MRALQSFMSVLKTAVVAVAICLFLGTSVAIAAPKMEVSATIEKGGFSVANDEGIPVAVKIESATAELPADVVGGMATIIISNGTETELICNMIPVIEDIDLLRSPRCIDEGSPVELPLKLVKGSKISVKGVGFVTAENKPVSGEDLKIEFGYSM